MDITIDNFEDELPNILQHVDNSDFLSIDLEFSGLIKDKIQSSCNLDDQEENYMKLRDRIKHFAILQIGISFFYLKPEMKSYTYNIELFRQRESKLMKTINQGGFQYESIQFLGNNQFDFNKWVRKGINYGRISEKDKLYRRTLKNVTKQVKEQHQKSSQFKQKKTDLKEILKDLLRPNQYLSRETLLQMQETKTCLDQMIQQFKSQKNKKQIKFQLNCYNQLVYNLLKKYQNLQILAQQKLDYISAVAVNDKEYHLDIEIRTSKKENEVQDDKDVDVDVEKEINSKTKSIFDQQYGFGYVFERIIEKQKILVFHNGGYDLVYLYENLVDELPQSLQDFRKRYIENMKCNVLDTKLIAKKFDKKYIESSLESLFKKYNEQGGKNMEQFSKYENSSQYHEAGFDSMATGHVLIGLVKEYYVMQEKQKYEMELNSQLNADGMSKKEIQLQKQKIKEKVNIRKQELSQADVDYVEVMKGFFNRIRMPMMGEYELKNFDKSEIELDREEYKEKTVIVVQIEMQSKIKKSEIMEMLVALFGEYNVKIQKNRNYVCKEQQQYLVQLQYSEKTAHELIGSMNVPKDEKFTISLLPYQQKQRYQYQSC